MEFAIFIFLLPFFKHLVFVFGKSFTPIIYAIFSVLFMCYVSTFIFLQVFFFLINFRC